MNSPITWEMLWQSSPIKRSVDLLTKKYPELTPYQFASNRPIDGIDLDGMEYLSFNKSMYRLQYSTTTSDIKMGDGSIRTISTSQTVVETVYENIPSELQDAKAKSFKYVSGGPVTSLGRDYTPEELSNVVYNTNKHFVTGPQFYGAANGGKSTKDINSLKGNASMQQQNLAQNISGVGGAIGPNGFGGIIVNFRNGNIYEALSAEGDLRDGFYNATSMIDFYFSINYPNGKNVFQDELKGPLDRVELINFISDGYLKTEITDNLIGSGFSTMRQNQYGKQLKVAWAGLQIMKEQGIEIRKETIDSIKNVLEKYKRDGGGNQYDNINQLF